jgi:hypothetical protein
MPEPDKQALMSQAGAIVDELIKSGEWAGGEGLAGGVEGRAAGGSAVRPSACASTPT